jgi:hypothetical protein
LNYIKTIEIYLFPLDEWNIMELYKTEWYITNGTIRELWNMNG